MSSVTHLAEAERALTERGYLVIERAISDDVLTTVREGLAPLLARAAPGRNEFEGARTRRVYALLAKTRALDALVLDPLVVGLCERVLGRNCLLSAALTVHLLPGETPQPFHCDGLFYGVPRPRAPIGLSTVWALDDFTTDNGATEVVAGSHAWGEQWPRPDHAAEPVCMPAGSVLVFPDSLWHRSGANRSAAPRSGVTIQYCAAWARQIENMVLAVPPPIARELPPRLQELLGYSIHPPFVGYVDGKHPRRLLEAE